MDEGGTLDFDDLMDTGDEFPGFEIAKFTPANKCDGIDDGVLRTPEHEKDDEDYIINENKTHYKRTDDDINSAEVVEDNTNREISDDVATLLNMKEDSVEENVAKDTDTVDPSETGDCKSDSIESNHDVPTEMGDNKSGMIEADNNEGSCKSKEDVNEAGAVDQQTEELLNESISQDASENKMNTELQDSNEDSCEPAQKKKKMYLKPPQNKTPIESKISKTEESVYIEDVDEKFERNCHDSEHSRDSHSVTENGQKDDVEIVEDDEESEGKSREEDEEEPHQQSFLSFFNLKPGSSKPKEEEMKKQESLQEEFFSRKRLRTRKKVSYCEDVAAEEDDEYKVEEDDEEDYDHEIDSRQSPRSRNNSRRNSGASSYAKALQNLLPGVDLSYLQNNQLENHTSSEPKSEPKSEPSLTPVITAKSNTDGLKPQGNLKGLFECGLCGTFFNTASQFISHQETTHAGEKKNGRSAMETFRCEVCGFVLTNRFAYLEHKKMKHHRGSTLTFSCTKCKLSKFTDLNALQKHQQVCGMPFCSTCGATFKAWVDVAEHRKKVHAPPVPTRQWLNCVNKTCSFKCVTQHEMTQHIQAKHINDYYSCSAPRCNLVFETREQLVEHKKEAHASEFIVQYQCMECKNCFSSKTLLAEHQYLHTLEKLRKCDLCLRQFGNVNDLRKHKDVHASKGTIRCQSCQRWCVDKVELVNHVCAQKRRNTGIRLYFCDVCHKDFRSDEKMFIHRKEHKNFFQCSSCLWECSSESEYFEHREVHGKFTCKECCEEMDEKDVEMHTKAHKYYIKLEEMENNGKNEKVMFLCPNLFNAIQA